MKIYETEILDGLSDAIKADAIAIECPIIESKEFSGDLSDSLNRALANIGLDKVVQSDLYYLNSVLVSAGWNKNDDVFAPADLWAAKDTPIDKQFNYMHDETDIIGHMTNSAVMGPDGQLIDSSDNLPEQFDIITSAVIYKSWGDPALRERVNELITKIEAGELYVSMECMFKDFDYALIDSEGSAKVIGRDNDSAFLTKHLRVYGGTGEYGGYRIGRMLKSLTFTGKGLVDRPANPRSIIFRDSNPFSNPTTANINFFTTATEVNMEEVQALQAELDSAKAEAQTLSTSIAEKDTTISALEVKVKELEDAIASISSEKMALSTELQKMVNDVKAMKRKASLVEAGADEAQADELLTKFADATDEMFASVITLVTAKPKEEMEEEDEEEDCAALEVEVETASLQDPPEDNTEKVIASAAAWLRESVLKTTKNL